MLSMYDFSQNVRSSFSATAESALRQMAATGTFATAGIASRILYADLEPHSFHSHTARTLPHSETALFPSQRVPLCVVPCHPGALATRSTGQIRDKECPRRMQGGVQTK